MCVGCGACYYACDTGGISLVNVPAVGIRPRFETEACASCTKCLSICPGQFLDADLASETASPARPTDHEFGPVLEVWEGYASDPDVRFRGSSGGMISALALYCLERAGMKLVLHTGMDEEKPWLNKTVVSRTRAEIVANAGSRYAPASPCEGLKQIEDSDGPCVFIGKPCDAAAVEMTRLQKSKLDQKLGVVLTFFCAGTPSTEGTTDILKSLDITPEEIESLKYRGEGWPGRFRVLYGERAQQKSLSYKESWGKLTKYRPMRCNLCPDGLGRLADISCGDAWDKYNEDGDVGRSLVLVRTERGRSILHGAVEAGYADLKLVEPEVVLAAQVNLLQRRREIFGRLLGMRLLGIPVPTYLGFSLRQDWLRLPFMTKIRTVFGTMRRAFTRKLWKRRPLFGVQPAPSEEKGGLTR